MGKSAGFLLHSIIDALTDDLLNLVRKIVGNIEDIEDLVFDEQQNAAGEISYIRRQITVLRRIAIPLKRTLNVISTKDILFIIDLLFYRNRVSMKNAVGGCRHSNN
jgi:magnesium transporter